MLNRAKSKHLLYLLEDKCDATVAEPGIGSGRVGLGRVVVLPAGNLDPLLRQETLEVLGVAGTLGVARREGDVDEPILKA